MQSGVDSSSHQFNLYYFVLRGRLAASYPGSDKMIQLFFCERTI